MDRLAAGEPGPLPAHVLPPDIRSRIVRGVGDIDVHILEAGYDAGRPAIILLHGFPELAWCWRLVMPLLAGAGYHAIAPDQRGYGRTTPQPGGYQVDLEPYATGRLAQDIVRLLAAMQLPRVAAMVGHDAGAIVAGFCALARSDLMGRLILSASPFAGAPGMEAPPPAPFIHHPVHAELASLPRPCRHYQAYYCGPQANEDMWHAPQGMHDFLRGYYHRKSADWGGNVPRPMNGWVGRELARMPDYYCMPADRSMADIAAAIMPDARSVAQCAWLSEADLSIAAAEFARTGFQPALNWYRSAQVEGMTDRDLAPFRGQRVEVPVSFIAGSADWGPYQAPGLIDAMRDRLANRPVALHFIDGAGHWVHQEQAGAFADILLSTLAGTD